MNKKNMFAFFALTLSVLLSVAVPVVSGKIGPEEESPGEEKEPLGFIGEIFDRVRNFLSRLFSKLPVPDFVKDFFRVK